MLWARGQGNQLMHEEYKHLLEELRDTYFLIQNDTIIFVSDHSVERSGYSRDELVGKPMLELIAPEEREWLQELHRDRLDGKPVRQRYETVILRKDGGLVPVELSVWLTRYHGQPAVAGIATDITERRKAEEALRRSDGTYATLFEHSPISLWEEDWSAVKSYVDNLRGSGVENLKLYFNEHPDAVAHCLSLIKLKRPNYTAENTMSADTEKIFPNEERISLMANPDRFFTRETWDNLKENLIKILEGQTNAEIEITFRPDQGYNIYNLVKLSVAAGCENTLQSVFISVLDLTMRKKAQENYRQLLEDINDGYGVIQDGKYVYVNRKLGELFGYEAGQILGQSIEKTMLPEDRQAKMQEYEKVIRGEKAPDDRYEGDMLRGDGKKIPVDLSIKAFDYRGKPAFSVLFRDITERRRIEGLLQESRERFQALIESTSDWIWEVDANVVYTYASPKVEDLLGYKPEEIIGRTAFDFMPPEEAKRVEGNFKPILNSRKPFERLENRCQSKDGRLVILETSGVPIFNTLGQFQGYRGIDREITDRKQADKQLRQAYEMLRLMFECAPYGVITTDSGMNIVQANENMVKLLGFTHKDQIIGKSCLDFIPQHFHKKAGQALNRLKNSNSTLDVEHAVVKADGSKIIVMTSSGVLRDSSGNLLGLIITTRDITIENQLKENRRFYIAETIKASENERKRMARALHDDTIQEIMFATYRLQDIISGNCGSLTETVNSSLKDIQLLLKRIATEVRSFTTNLRPDILDDMGLIPALEWLNDRLRDESGIETKLKIIGREKRLTPETELTLFRIAQEALTNVRKHAHASAVEIKMEFDESNIIMSVSDNGGGFELPSTISHFARQQKLGLIGIVERARLLGGTYEVRSSPGEGTVLMIEVSS